MKRREILRGMAGVGVAGALHGASGKAFASGLLKGEAVESKPPLARPTADQAAWQDLEVGMFVHFAPNTWQDLESDDLSTPLSAINPEKLDTDQWARTALSFGAKYIVFVAKHAGGFCMWQTQTTEYSIRNTPWRGGKGDVLADVSASCKKYGLKLGVYVSPQDGKFGAGNGGRCKIREMQAKYDAMYREQWTEVLSRYGELCELWYDGSTVTPVVDLLAKYQPHAAVFQGPAATIRWVGNEDGYAPYPCWNGIASEDAKSGSATSLHSNPDAEEWMPVETDVSIRRPDWFWHTNNADKVLTPEQLVSLYYCSVGRGAQLLLNIPANRDGLLPEEDCAPAKAFGDEVRRRFSTPVAETAGKGATLELKLDGKQADTVILQEEILQGGERIRQYRIEAQTSAAWRTVAEGTAVGHKRIQPIAPGAYRKLRLVVVENAGTPLVRRFAAFHTGAEPPKDWNRVAYVWADDVVGRWQDHAFSIDVTEKIDSARQYKLRFVGEMGAVSGLSGVMMEFDGIAQPQLVRPMKGKPNELILNITGIGQKVIVTGHVEGDAGGEILLQKL